MDFNRPHHRYLAGMRISTFDFDDQPPPKGTAGSSKGDSGPERGYIGSLGCARRSLSDISGTWSRPASPARRFSSCEIPGRRLRTAGQSHRSSDNRGLGYPPTVDWKTVLEKGTSVRDEDPLRELRGSAPLERVSNQEQWLAALPVLTGE